jgi:hypothetical protein
MGMPNITNAFTRNKGWDQQIPCGVCCCVGGHKQMERHTSSSVERSYPCDQGNWNLGNGSPVNVVQI